MISSHFSLNSLADGWSSAGKEIMGEKLNRRTAYHTNPSKTLVDKAFGGIVCQAYEETRLRDGGSWPLQVGYSQERSGATSENTLRSR